ncbi:MAG: insulinase family protein [Dehalococcoidia bacterium]|nr:MAG: insulinase family protein [Dehalococcoidia bacterium]
MLKTTLANGLCLLTETMPHTRSVTASVFLATGSRYETDEIAGAAHFIEHMCFKGTASYPTPREIATAIEGVGGSLNGGTDKELTVYWAKVPDFHFATALKVLSEMVTSPRFEPEEMTKERNVIIEEISMSLDYPPARSEMLIDELLWPGHPLGRDIAGTKKSVSAISLDDLLGFLSIRYIPQKTVVSLAGNIEHETALELVNKAFGNWPQAPVPPVSLPYRRQMPPGRIRVEKKDIEQTNICLALPALPVEDPRRFQLDLMNVILGEGSSSRLFCEIRDKLGLTYNIQSHLSYYLDAGSLNVYAATEPQNLATLIRAILEQIHRLRDDIPEDELKKARELSKGRLLLRMEDSRNVSGYNGSQEILTGKVLSVDEVSRRLEAVTADQVRQLARELVSDDNLRLAAVGPVDIDLESLLKL